MAAWKRGRMSCSCGRVYTLDAFSELPLLMVSEGFVYRTCPCRAIIYIDTKASAHTSDIPCHSSH